MSGWALATLGDVAEIEREVIGPEAIGTGTNYVGLEHMTSEGTFASPPVVHRGDLASAKFSFTSSHLLYGKLRPYLSKIARPDFDGVCSTDILPVRPGPALDRSYLHHCLRLPSMVALANSRSVGANLPRLSPSVLAAFEIPLPPLPEQRRIAQVLDRAETLRAQRRQALAQLDALAESIFLDTFGNPLTNPKAWSLTKLSTLGTLDRGVSKHRPRNEPALLGGPHPLIQTGDVANCDRYIRTFTATYSDVGLRQSRKWPAGTLCITIAANIAKTGVLSFDACFPDSVVGFTPNELTTTAYVQTWLSFLQKLLEDSAPESAQKNINLATLRDLNVPLPPIELQRSYGARLATIEQMKATQRQASDQLDALFASLQHRAFRGEL